MSRVSPPLSFRRATIDDLPAIIALLVDDTLGAGRDSPQLPLDQAYRDAFARIAADPNQQILVAILGEQVVGTLQLTFLPGLSNRGAVRALVEAVRIASSHRGQGLGEAFLTHARTVCEAAGCRTMELTTSNERVDAQRFYRKLGFVNSHQGYKLRLGG